MDCHDAATNEHPWDQTISTAISADWSAWAADIVNRVPVQNPTAADPPNAKDQVFCLSCHKAHGSPNPGATIRADGLSLESTCAQCHNQ
jgi:predicted CXXCH cytochrome family protein